MSMSQALAPFAYTDRRVIVTGCSSGIGRATAELVNGLGAEVIGLDVKPLPGAEYTIIEADLSEPESIDAAVEKVGGPLDGLFNCAGLSGRLPALDVVKVNFLGLRQLTEALVPRMGAGAAIVNVASLGGLGWEADAEILAGPTGLLSTPDFAAGVAWWADHSDHFRHPVFGHGGYQASKKAVILYTIKRAYALAGLGIRINSTGPTRTITPMLDDTRAAHGDGFIDSLPRPFGRDSEAIDQARVLAFLNSAAASFVNGQHLWVDAGEVAGMLAGDIPNPRTAARR
jgi:NAD(P)-dependent dehydrogenase (short-subunit alcohol dehydrogenase family)